MALGKPVRSEIQEKQKMKTTYFNHVYKHTHVASHHRMRGNRLILDLLLRVFILTLSLFMSQPVFGQDAPALVTKMRIVATDYSYAGIPQTIRAGLVQATFVNKGKTEHEALFVKVPERTTRDTVANELLAINQGGRYPSSMLAATGVHPVAPGKKSVSIFNLTPGHYFIICDLDGMPGKSHTGKFHFQWGMITPLDVTGTGGTNLPSAEDTLTAGDYWFDISQLRAGRHTVLFRNVGPKQWHFAGFGEFSPGTTKAEAEAIMEKSIKTMVPPPNLKMIQGSEAASPGYGNTFTSFFAKGRVYVVADWMHDKSGGPPHAIDHHMWKVFTVK